MPATPSLALPTSPRTALFRLIIAILKADPILDRTIHPKGWKAWEGDPADRAPLALNTSPSIRVTPRAGPEDFWSTDSQRGTLVLHFELAVRGTCYDDLDNLWFAVERAIYPRDATRRAAAIAAFQAAGAHTGLAKFSQPAFDDRPDAEAGGFLGLAQLSIEYRLSVS